MTDRTKQQEWNRLRETYLKEKELIKKKQKKCRRIAREMFQLMCGILRK